MGPHVPIDRSVCFCTFFTASYAPNQFEHKDAKGTKGQDSCINTHRVIPLPISWLV